MTARTLVLNNCIEFLRPSGSLSKNRYLLHSGLSIMLLGAAWGYFGLLDAMGILETTTSETSSIRILLELILMIPPPLGALVAVYGLGITHWKRAISVTGGDRVHAACLLGLLAIPLIGWIIQARLITRAQP